MEFGLKSLAFGFLEKWETNIHITSKFHASTILIIVRMQTKEENEMCMNIPYFNYKTEIPT